MIRIGIILGSTRPNRNGEQVAHWVRKRASQRRDAGFALLDLRDFPLPFLEEAPLMRNGPSHDERIRAWADQIASFDGFVIVTPEYNRSPSAVLKNALDSLYGEWNDKAVGFVSYGVVGGARAVEHLRVISGALQMADVSNQVAISLYTEFENGSTFTPSEHTVSALDGMLDQLVAWTAALTPLRAAADAAA